MGQKVHPVGFRLAVNKDWDSKWFATRKDYASQVHQDIKVRKYLNKRMLKGSLSRIVIERAWNSVRVTLHSTRPGMIIGKRGKDIEEMTDDISKICNGAQVKIDINEIRQPDLDAQWIACQIATQLERRVNFRRAMKRSIQSAMDNGADGIKVRVAGRLQGGDIARAEGYRQGKVPLQTLRSPIHYGFAEAETVWGIIGVKVWLNKKEESEMKGQRRRAPSQRRERGDRGDRGDRGGRGRHGESRHGERRENPEASAAPAESAAAEPAAEKA